MQYREDGSFAAVGPFARIEAARGADRVSRAQLAKGRLLARITSDGAYAPLGIVAGVNYVWMDSAAGWRAVVVPAAEGVPVLVKRMKIITGHRDVADLPFARWVPRGAAMPENVTARLLDTIWVRCAEGCCYANWP